MRCQPTAKKGRPAAQLDEAANLLRLAQPPWGHVAHVGPAGLALVSGRAQASFSLCPEVTFCLSRPAPACKGKGGKKGGEGVSMLHAEYQVFRSMTEFSVVCWFAAMPLLLCCDVSNFFASKLHVGNCTVQGIVCTWCRDIVSYYYRSAFIPKLFLTGLICILKVATCQAWYEMDTACLPAVVVPTGGKGLRHGKQALPYFIQMLLLEKARHPV